MALITCPECGKQFSEFADRCPNCSCPTTKIKEILQLAEHPKTTGHPKTADEPTGSGFQDKTYAPVESRWSLQYIGISGKWLPLLLLLIYLPILILLSPLAKEIVLYGFGNWDGVMVMASFVSGVFLIPVFISLIIKVRTKQVRWANVMIPVSSFSFASFSWTETLEIVKFLPWLLAVIIVNFLWFCFRKRLVTTDEKQ